MSRRDTWMVPSLCVALLASVGLAEGPDHAGGGHSSDTRLVGASTLRPLGEGFVSVGGRALRWLPPGAKRWKTVFENPGDNLYRVACNDAGERVLAGWEKDPNLHLFAPRKGTHVSFPRVSLPASGAAALQLVELSFSADGGSALVLMGARANTAGPFALWRVPLDGSGRAEQLLLTDGSLLVASGPWGAIFALPPGPKRSCSRSECFPNSAGLVAYEVTSAGLSQRMLLSAEQLQVRRMHAVRTQDPNLVAVLLEPTRGGRAMLLYKPASGEVALNPLPAPNSVSQPTRWAVVTRTGELVTLSTRGVELMLNHEALIPGNPGRFDELASRSSQPTPVYGLGVRADGTTWVHWGDFLALVDPRGVVRGVPLEPLVGKVEEWAGADVYVEASDTLWLGMEVGRGRDYARVALAHAEKRAAAWPRTSALGCRQLPPVEELLRWKVMSLPTCSGGRPNPRVKPSHPAVVKTLPDGTLIVDRGVYGCVRARLEPCHMK